MSANLLSGAFKTNGKGTAVTGANAGPNSFKTNGKGTAVTGANAGPNSFLPVTGSSANLSNGAAVTSPSPSSLPLPESAAGPGTGTAVLGAPPCLSVFSNVDPEKTGAAVLGASASGSDPLFNPIPMGNPPKGGRRYRKSSRKSTRKAKRSHRKRKGTRRH